MLKKFWLSCLVLPLGLALSPSVSAVPSSLAGLPFTPDATAGSNDLQGQLRLPFDQSAVVNVTYHVNKSDQVVSAFLKSPLAVKLNAYTFEIEGAQFDPEHKEFVGDAKLTGPHLPGRILAKGVHFDQRGIVSVDRLTNKGWGTAHSPWKIAHGSLSPSGLNWNNRLKEVEVKGLFLQGVFHPELAAEIKDGKVASVKLLKPTTILHQRRVAFIKDVHLVNGEMHVDGYCGDPAGKRWHFKNTLVKPDGTLAVEFPISWIPPDKVSPVQLQPVAQQKPASLPLMASASNTLPPTAPSTLKQLQSTVQSMGKMPDDLFGRSSALDKAIAKGLTVLPIDGAPNLQMVVTQTSNDGKTVDGFIPLMDWVGQAQVYGATRNGNSVSVDKATMNWLKKTAHPPASSFGNLQLQDPIILNKATGRLSSGVMGQPSFRGMTAGLVSWEVDTKEFRFECGHFDAVGAKLNPLGAAAPWSFTMSTTGGGLNVAGQPSVPSDVPMAGPNEPINVGYQGGAEFDIVFLEGGDWGFEFRTAIPQLDIGGPEWMRTGVAKAPKGVKWPTIFAKIYNRGFVYLNFVGTGISIPFNDGLAFTSPGLLFSYVPDQSLFYLLVQTQITVVDVDPNIFAVRGRLFIDGSGMGKSGGGEAELTGYILNVQVAEFDVGFGATRNPDGTYEEEFAVTVPVMDILGFFKVQVSGEVKVHAPPGDWCVGVSGWVHIIFFDIGVTFYAYTDGHISFAFGGHEFHIATNDGNNPQYNGPYTLLGINWFGTETVDSAKGGVQAAGKSNWSSNPNLSMLSTKLDGPKMTALATLSNAALSEEGVNSCQVTLSNVTVSTDFNGKTLTANATSLPMLLDAANGKLNGTISGVDIDTGSFKGKIDVDLSVNFTGTMDVGFNLPASEGGRLTEQISISSIGNNTVSK